MSDVDSGFLEEFLRFGGPSTFPCGCSAYEAVNISRDLIGSDAYPTGTGFISADVDEFRAQIGDEPVIWWHKCPSGKNVVLRSGVESG